MKRIVVTLVPLLGLLISACSKTHPTQEQPSSATSTTQASTDSSAEPPTPRAPAEPAAPKTRVFEGTYTTTPGTLYIPTGPSEYKMTKQAPDDGGLLGPGTLSLTVAPDGRVSGASTAGPLGDAVLEGVLEGDRLTASIRRKDPSDDGLTGTLVGTVHDGKLEGSMELANGNAGTLREAKLVAAQK